MNQHYVPKAYLKQFAEKKSRGNYVDVYDKERKIIFNTNVSNICSERDLYTLDKDTEVASDIYTIEKIYSDGFEPMYEKAYTILTDDTILSISMMQRIEILIGIFQLYMRNPRFLTSSIKHHKKEIAKLIEMAKFNKQKGITYLDEDFSFREWDEDSINEHIAFRVTKTFKEKHILGIQDIGVFHEYSKFEVSKIRDDSQFFTSDNPLVLEDLVTSDGNPMSKSKDFVITLNPKYALRIHHDNTIELNMITRIPALNVNVGMINDAIFQQSSRFIIGSTKSFEDYFKILEFLMDSSLERKIDSIQQIVKLIPLTLENLATIELMNEFLKKYEDNGTLTNQQVYEFHKMIREETIKWKKNRID